MAFFNSAVGVLQTLVIALGAGLGIWGVINLLEGYGSDNPGANAHVRTSSASSSRSYPTTMLMCDKVTPQYDRQPPLLFRTKGHSIRRVHDFMLYLKY